MFDGLLYQAFKSGSNAYVQYLATGTGIGSTLTGAGAGGVVEIDAALKNRWDNYRLSPDTMWVGAAYWSYEAYPYIRSYFDPPRTLEELRQNNKPGYDDHHVVEQWSKNDGMPPDNVEAAENIVTVPTLKHWEINGWLSKKNAEFKDIAGNELTPRQYVRGKTWEDRYQFGLDVLKRFKVLKP